MRNVVVDKGNVARRVRVVDLGAVDERVVLDCPPAHPVVRMQCTRWFLPAIAAPTRQAQVRGNVFKEVGLDRLTSVRPVSPAVNGAGIRTSLNQRVEMVVLDCVVVTGQQHAKVRPVRHHAPDEVVTDATQAYTWGVLVQQSRKRRDGTVADGMVCCNQRLPITAGHDHAALASARHGNIV